ncbi:MAG: OmpA family protein [Cytophagales bacterium]|nr:OmpA family protein [Cytophagales bacterium]
MSTRQLIMVTFFVILIIPVAIPQSNKKLDKQYNRALELLYEEHFDIARIEFEEINRVNPDYRDVEYRLELTYFLDGESNRSLDRLLSFETTLGSKDKFYHYWLGRVFAKKYMFGEAIGSWNDFLSKDFFKSKEIRQETSDFIRSTEVISSFFEENTDYVVTLLPETINTAEAELNPAFSADNQQLLYSTAAVSSNKKEIFEIRGSKLARYETDMIWQPPIAVASLNAVEDNNTRFCLTYWGDQVETLVAKNNGILHTSTLSGEDWQAPVRSRHEIKLPGLGPDFTMNRKQDRIIFTSRKNIKKNGYDLYEMRYDSILGGWTNPEPIPAINTTMDESSPFLTYDENTLYFSSNGHDAIGGFDIFYSKWDQINFRWGKPVQMNYPINTPDDDINFKLAKDGASGYFSSNRVFSRGDFDIFHFSKVPKSRVYGNIVTASTQEPVSDVQIIFLPKTYVSERYATVSDKNGSFEMQLLDEESYTVQIKRGHQLEVEDELRISGELSQELKFMISDNPEEGIALVPVVKEVVMAEPKSNQRQTTQAPKVYSEVDRLERIKKGYKLVRENIYFLPGGNEVSHDPDDILYKAVRLLGIKKELQIEVAGHTDNTGSNSDNLKVSLARAKKVRNWLVNLGVSSDRIKIAGYGDAKPISTNDDEEEGRELNRRVELRVVSAPI